MATFTSITAASWSLTYAGIPFLTDVGKRATLGAPSNETQGTVRTQQADADIIGQINRLYQLKYLQDWDLPGAYPGRALGGIAYRSQIGPEPNPDPSLYDLYYPTTCCRWSVFRGLATSTQAKAMLAATQGNDAATFFMGNLPLGAFNQPKASSPTPASNYSIATSMFMLPPRPLAEHGGGFDGIYLITLVDERFYFQGTPATTGGAGVTWDELIAYLAGVLDISISYSPLSPAYTYPEVDSSLWANAESAAVLLDAVAYNLGRVAVRLLNGDYLLQTYAEAQQMVTANRGRIAGTTLTASGSILDYDTSQVVRVAGGDIFQSGTSRLKIGQLGQARNAVVPVDVTVSFPKYITGDDPVPHFFNPRYQNPRPSAWIEDSYGDTYDITVPISRLVVTLVAGGSSTTEYVPASPMVSGLIGTSNQYLHTTAKALYATEFDASYNSPLNDDLLTTMAQRLAQDYYEAQVAAALDEVYPGVWAWTPEAIHDIVWSWSERERRLTTRVTRNQWNLTVTEFQHGTPVDLADNFNGVPRGVGGPSVAQTVRDSFGQLGRNKTPSKETLEVSIIDDPILGPTTSILIQSTDNKPDKKPFYIRIDDEVMLVLTEALFDLPTSTWTWGVLRGQQNTEIADHSFGTSIYRTGPGPIIGQIGAPMFLTDDVAVFSLVDNFPTNQRWKGIVDNEIILFDGTSGGLTGGAVLTTGELLNSGAILKTGSFITSEFMAFANGQAELRGAVKLPDKGYSLMDAVYAAAGTILSKTAVLLNDAIKAPNGIGVLLNDALPFGTPQQYLVTMPQRGVDGTLVNNHNGGSFVQQLGPNTNYGTNLVTYGAGEFAFPAQATSGGIAGVNKVPQTQTVQALTSTGGFINGVYHYSGQVISYDTTAVSGSQYTPSEFCWLTERNTGPIQSGAYYNGQFVGYSSTGDLTSGGANAANRGRPSPVYAVNKTASLAVQDTRYCTTLASAVALTDTSIKVASSALFPAAGSPLPVLIKIGNEEMAITSGLGTTTWNVVRGVNFVVEEHPNYEPVCQVFSAWKANLTGAIGKDDDNIVVVGVRNFPTTGRFYVLIDAEIMLVVDRALTGPISSEGNLADFLADVDNDDVWTWAVDRAQQGTPAATHDAGATVFQWLPDDVAQVQRIIFDDSAFVQPGTEDPATGAPTVVHHEVSQVVKLTASLPNASGLYSASLQKWDAVNMVWLDDVSIWVIDINQKF